MITLLIDHQKDKSDNPYQAHRTKTGICLVFNKFNKCQLLSFLSFSQEDQLINIILKCQWIQGKNNQNNTENHLIFLFGFIIFDSLTLELGSFSEKPTWTTPKVKENLFENYGVGPTNINIIAMKDICKQVKCLWKKKRSGYNYVRHKFLF